MTLSSQTPPVLNRLGSGHAWSAGLLVRGSKGGQVAVWWSYQLLPEGLRGGGSGASERVVFSSPASGILSPPSNIPNTATEYFVPALRGKGNDIKLLQSQVEDFNVKVRCPQS